MIIIHRRRRRRHRPKAQDYQNLARAATSSHFASATDSEN